MICRWMKMPKMRVAAKILIAGLMMVGTASVLWAAGEGGAEKVVPILSMEMFWRVVNFAVLAILLYKFLAQPMRDFFAGRREAILKSLEEAKKSKEEAEAKYRELSDRLANRDEEFADIRKKAIENAEKLKERLIAEAHEKAKRMEEKAKESIEQEMKKARETLKREAVELALKLSEEKLVQELTPGDHRRFMDEYIAGLK
ncbi:MAG: F0F1 ATP synthase subunit B [Deltaproteobacteria bacterium]|nr:F0F1 ATP synthase subunit B [Deltaproteobacteria bacterium]